MAYKLRPGNPPRLSILSDPDVQRWYNNLAQGSQITADVFTRRLGAVCDRLGKTPTQLLKLSEEQLYNALLDFVAEQQREGKAGTYIAHSLVATRSWLSHHGIRINRKIKVKGAYANPTIADERVPTPEELKRVLLGANARERLAIALMAFSGLRPEVLGNYLGNDGLRLKDFPEVKVEGKRVVVEKVPARIVVRAELSKAAHRYFSFLGEEGCDYLRAYLDERLEDGQKLAPESDIIHPGWAGKQFVRTINIGDIIRQPIRRAGYPWRPYILRAYFDTQLLLSESRGKVAHDYRVFWMGHKGSMEARYTTNKGRLPTEMIEDMRGAYQRCEGIISTLPSRNDNQGRIHAVRVLLLGLKYTDDELAKLDLENLSSEALQELVSKKLAQTTPPPPPVPAPVKKHKVVPPAEVEKWVEEGWVPKMKLSETQVVLSPPEA